LTTASDIVAAVVPLSRVGEGSLAMTASATDEVPPTRIVFRIPDAPNASAVAVGTPAWSANRIGSRSAAANPVAVAASSVAKAGALAST